VTELVDRLNMVKLLDAELGPRPRPDQPSGQLTGRAREVDAASDELSDNHHVRGWTLSRTLRDERQ